jgi:hypothetical protein
MSQSNPFKKSGTASRQNFMDQIMSTASAPLKPDLYNFSNSKVQPNQNADS